MSRSAARISARAVSKDSVYSAPLVFVQAIDVDAIAKPAGRCVVDLAVARVLSEEPVEGEARMLEEASVTGEPIRIQTRAVVRGAR